MDIHHQQESLMREALRLAQQPAAPPYPNPWVGCVVARKGKITGRGFHRGPGFNHAEIEALNQAGARARGATLYVTLEPCCHQGRTPPCTETILKAGVGEVVYALRDPNPLVAGQGARILKKHGITVHQGLCAPEAAALNEVYLKFRATGLPFVTAKIATSLDGKIATRTGDSKWITDPAARRLGRELRAENQAIVAGINTILADDPHLGARRRGVPDPWRIILDSKLRIPLESRVVQSGKCIVACATDAPAAKRRRLEHEGAEVWAFKGQRVPLRPLLKRLAENDIISLLMEGGSEALGSFLDENAVDRIYWFLSPIIIGSRHSPSAVAGSGAAKLAAARCLRDPQLEPVGKSWLVRGKLSAWALA